MGLIAWIVLGAIAGFLANLLMHGRTGVLGSEPEQRHEETIHERRIRLNRLLARGTTEMGGPQEVHVGVEVLAEQLESEPAPTVGALGLGPVEAALGLGLDTPELTKQFRRHGETLARGIDVVKLGAHL